MSLVATQFGEGLLDCRGRANRLIEGESCLAIGTQGWTYGRTTSSAIGYTLGAVQFGIAIEKRLNEAWDAGAALGYANTLAQADGNIWNVRTQLFQSGVFARRYFGDFALTAGLIGGAGLADTRRYPTPQSSVQGDQNLSYFGGKLRAEQGLAALGGTIKLRLDLDIISLHAGHLTEGGGVGRLCAASSSVTNVSLNPTVEWSTPIDWRDGYVVTPHIRMGIIQILKPISRCYRDPVGIWLSGCADARRIARCPHLRRRASRSGHRRSWRALGPPWSVRPRVGQLLPGRRRHASRVSF